MTQSITRQGGFALLEALIAIVIFSLGALTMIALQANGIAAQADAQFRIEAANMVDRMIGQITLNVDRTSATSLQTSLLTYAHQPTTTSRCNFAGNTSANTDVTAWVNAATTGAARLPGSTTTMQQIQVDTVTFNKVTVTVCWQGAADATPRSHTVIAFIN